MKRSNLARAAPLFAALGDETRLRLLARLGRAGPQSITQLAAGMPVTRQAVTKHLRALEAAGLARARRRGRERVWAVESARLEDAQRYLDVISAQWDSAIERLRIAVEE
jgi:DNA-binding transcriptional ArsR family regulator